MCPLPSSSTPRSHPAATGPRPLLALIPELGAPFAAPCVAAQARGAQPAPASHPHPSCGLPGGDDATLQRGAEGPWGQLVGPHPHLGAGPCPCRPRVTAIHQGSTSPSLPASKPKREASPRWLWPPRAIWPARHSQHKCCAETSLGFFSSPPERRLPRGSDGSVGRCHCRRRTPALPAPGSPGRHHQQAWGSGGLAQAAIPPGHGERGLEHPGAPGCLCPPCHKPQARTREAMLAAPCPGAVPCH